jgi:hypothetical protein
MRPLRLVLFLLAPTLILLLGPARNVGAQGETWDAVIDPWLSTVEKACDYPLILSPCGRGTPVGDLGLVVTCRDAVGDPIPGIPGSTFSLVPLDGPAITYWFAHPLTYGETDAQGRILLEFPIAGDGFLAGGEVGIRVGSQQLEEGVPLEIRSPDFNGDGIIDLIDVAAFNAAFQAAPADPHFDYDVDGDVDLIDFAVFSQFFMESIGSCPPGWPSPAGREWAFLPQGTLDVPPGCLALDLADDLDPTTIREEVTVGPYGQVNLHLIARDFVGWRGLSARVVIPSTLMPMTVDFLRDGAQVGSIDGQTVTLFTAEGIAGQSPCVMEGPLLIASIQCFSPAGGTYRIDDFDVPTLDFLDCALPPRVRTAALCNSPTTPCAVSTVEPVAAHHMSCPGGEFDASDTLVVTLRGSDRAPLVGVSADEIGWEFLDLLGSNRESMFEAVPLEPETDAQGRLPFLLAPREACRWDTCLNLVVYATYQDCFLKAYRRIRTPNVHRIEDEVPPPPEEDLVDAADLAVVTAAVNTANDCMDLVGRYRCPLVTGESSDVVADHLGHACVVTSRPPVLPASSVYLDPAHPNPFNPVTTITVRLTRPSEQARLVVFDASGRRVRTLFEGPLAAGARTFAWNGADGTGRRLASGVYHVRLVSEVGRAATSVVLLK